MGRQLNNLLGYNGEGSLGLMALDNKTGKHTVSQLESFTKEETSKNKRNISPNIAFAYAKIFNVTLDFIYGYSDDWNPDFKDVKERIGISDKAIKKLEDLEASRCTTDEKVAMEWHYTKYDRSSGVEKMVDIMAPQYAEVLSAIIEDEDFVNMISQLNRYCVYKQKDSTNDMNTEEKLGSEQYLQALDEIIKYNEVAIPREEFALISLQEATDLFKSIIKKMRPIPDIFEDAPFIQIPGY